MKMTNIEARNFFNSEILARWTQWDINEIELGDWIRVLRRYEEDSAVYAIRQYAENRTRFENKNPTIGRFKGFMANRPDKKEKEPTEWPECTTFVQSSDTGLFFDIVLNPPSFDPLLLSRAAENMRRKCVEIYSGVWKIYKDTKRWQMWGMQSEIRKAKGGANEINQENKQSKGGGGKPYQH